MKNQCVNGFMAGVKKIAVIFAIAVLLPATVNYGMQAFVKAPSDSTVFAAESHVSSVQSELDNYQNNSPQSRSIAEFFSGHPDAASKSPSVIKNQLAQAKVKLKTLKAEQNHFNAVFFYTGLIVGLLAILIGVFASLEVIDTGLIMGGSFSIIQGFCYYWDALTTTTQFGSLLVALIAVITVSYLKIVKGKTPIAA